MTLTALRIPDVVFVFDNNRIANRINSQGGKRFHFFHLRLQVHQYLVRPARRDIRIQQAFGRAQQNNILEGKDEGSVEQAKGAADNDANETASDFDATGGVDADAVDATFDGHDYYDDDDDDDDAPAGDYNDGAAPILLMMIILIMTRADAADDYKC